MADRPNPTSSTNTEESNQTPSSATSPNQHILDQEITNQTASLSNNQQSSPQPSSLSVSREIEAESDLSAAAPATTIEPQPQTTPSADSTINSNAATASFPVDPGPELRRGGGGFAALVDAFMAGFRQAASDARNERAPSSQSAQTTTSTSSDTNETNATSAAPPQNQNGVEATDVPQDTNDNASTGNNPNDVPPVTNTDTNQPTDNATNRPRTLFFRMPLGPDGRDALLAFTPGPIPTPEAGTHTTADLSGDRGNGLASGFHLPHSPIFVPLGASPLPFSFLFDAQTNTAWPIANITNGPPGAMPIEQPIPANLPQFVTGPPFRIALNVSYGPPPEAPRPDPERASRFVGSLERADAELRGRMARLGMGDIGDYGGSQNNEGGNGAALGCGICLDEYASEDRPEWIGGQSSIDEEVVAVPCAGHHTLHHRCLYEWLANTPPSQWTCPFCRAPLDKEKVDKSATEQEQQRQQQSRQRQGTNENEDNLKKKAELEAKTRSLREEVRLRERARGWRCDSPACLPRYPDSSNEEKECDHHNEESTVSDWPSDVTSLISLLPCRHKLHLDCLCTSMKLEQADLGSEDDSDEEAEEELEAKVEDQSVKSERLSSSKIESPPVTKKQTVGKWVTCPTCRHEAWAELPVRRKPKRVEIMA